jgi:signal transduction histidine kinase
MSHEIKTPLTVISGYVQQAAEELEEMGIDNKYINPALTKAHEEAMRLGRLTENALQMAVMQGSRDKIKPIDSSVFFTVNAEVYRSFIEKRGNSLTIRNGKNLPVILGDADQLFQVLTNLLANANKHTKAGEITVRVELNADRESKADYITVSVADTGAGIDPELLPHVFLRNISGSDGTGMGLPICKNIIETHGGAIDIESAAGKGTVVSFTIPVMNDERTGNDNG